MKIARKFTSAGTDPFATVEWIKRSSKITNPDGSVVFRMDDAEVPRTWSQLATDIMVSKYFRKAGVPQVDAQGRPMLDEQGRAVTGPERSARQVIHRLAGCWRQWGEQHGYFETADDAQAFYDELAFMLVHQVAAPNSPQWFNTGLNFAYGITGPAQGHYVCEPETGEVRLATDAYTHPQPHACFIQSIDDDLVNPGGIMDLWLREARLFKYGSGTGTNFSRLRGEDEPLSGGGKSSGLMSWLRIGDRAAGAIKSGGTTRRAAKMVCLDMDHPDIAAFIDWKVREEIKVSAMVEGLKHLDDGQRAVAADLGLKLDYDFNGEAYGTVSGQNSNNSVRIPDEFFDALDADAQWRTFWRLSNKQARSYKASELWDKLAFAAWRCADPGVQFDGTINAWHTCPSAGRINASNPCVTGDTLIATTTGLRRMRDLVGKTAEVIDARGNASYVDRIFPTGTKPVFELSTRAGYRLRLTADHKVFTLNRGDVPACELTVDDVVQLRGAGFGDDFLPPFAAEVLGAAMADACITRPSGADAGGLSVVHAEGAVAAHLGEQVAACRDWLDVGDGASGVRDGSSGGAATLHAGPAAGTMAKLLSRYAVLEQGAHARRLSDEALRLDRATQAAILRALFTAGGAVIDVEGEDQCVDLEATSLPLLQQVQLVLLSFGIKARLRRNRRALRHHAATHPDGRTGLAEFGVAQVHSLRIAERSRGVFAEQIGFLPQSAKAEHLAHLCAGADAAPAPLTDRVAMLLPAGQEEVFDLTEPVTHHFVAGGLVVHNCSEYMFLDNTACNLASINLIKLYDSRTRTFDVDAYQHAIDLWTIVLEISVLMAAFPSHEIARLSYRYRTLGLGYANLGALLMQAGLAYDSDEARALSAMFGAVLTGRSYRMSALLAAEHGAFAGYADDSESMLRVIRNHRLAAHGEARESTKYLALKIRPVPIDHALACSGRLLVKNARELLNSSVQSWDEALELGIQHGYRNAQVTVIAPTGTIGLLMDCDTTGVEPDFALVKFKKLAGGGYFKIANASVKPALEALGYSDKQIREILTYLLGTLTLDVAMPAALGGAGGTTLRDFLASKGLTPDQIDRANDALPGVFELSFAFSAWSLGDDALKRLGIDPDRAKADPAFNLLGELGLSPSMIEELNDTICGHQTVEGAPHLRDEHLSVFDCANTCGRRGVRSIMPEGHIRMMAAVQPFISGAISKTINLSGNASVADVKAAYRLSWELGLKANALYRDGCKLSQPLSSSSERKDETAGKAREDSGTLVAAAAESVALANSESAVVELLSAVAPATETIIKIVERPMRRRLPDTRASITHKFNIAGHEGYLTVGLYEDGMPGELFITMAKEGSTIGGLMDCIGTSVSVALQYGVPVESLVSKFTHQRFEPAGMTANPDIPFAKSLVDYIFRWMGMQFIPGYRDANAPRRESDTFASPREPAILTGPAEGEHAADETPRPVVRARTPEPASHLGGNGHTHVQVQERVTTIDVVASAGQTVSALAVAMQNAGDGPPCEVCGTITVRNGTCYKCVNCGTSQGCS